MNAWASIPTDTAAADGTRSRKHRVRFFAAVAVLPVAAALLAQAAGGSSTSATPQLATVRVAAAPAIPAMQPVEPAAAAAHAPAEPASTRFSGTVGADLTRSLEAAGVPEAMGREYVGLLAKAIDLNDGLTVGDRFDLVILRNEGGGLTELAFAGLDRVARFDVQLMKWTDGREVRWINADGLDPASQGMAMPVAGRVSSGFGPRFHPVLQYRRMHNGVDVAARHGAPIVSAASGRVVSSGWRGGYGRQVVIAHGDGLQTTYAHMSAIDASPGETVRQGQVIGYVGSSGLSTGPHLHYEVRRDGRLINPLSVKLAQSPLQGEELSAFRSTLRGLLTKSAKGMS